jgi:enterochelin esterase family protein
VNGKRFGGGSVQVEYYPKHPDSVENPNVPKGKITKAQFRSKVFDGTIREYSVYVPAQYTAEKPAALMVFQDGSGYLGGAAAATVFDNLIAKGDMPVTVGIFINPGNFEDGRSNRSFEYDTLSDQYARFLRDEMLPEVKKTVNLSDDPERHAICGISSGGICAFTAAWEMPNLFRKVLSHVGSFTNIASGPTLRAGGHNYEALVRKTPRKPLRIYLQDGSNDLDNEHGSWPLANQTLANSLRYAGYDYTFLYGQGFHSLAHGAATLPDALRWLWRDVR